MVLDQVRSNFEEPNSFVGRQRELAELSRLAASMRAVTLCGPGGIGKTRLARAGLVISRRIGQWTFYKRDEDAITAVKHSIAVGL